jgi:hypothetical protein
MVEEITSAIQWPSTGVLCHASESARPSIPSAMAPRATDWPSGGIGSAMPLARPGCANVFVILLFA